MKTGEQRVYIFPNLIVHVQPSISFMASIKASSPFPLYSSPLPFMPMTSDFMCSREVTKMNAYVESMGVKVHTGGSGIESGRYRFLEERTR